MLEAWRVVFNTIRQVRQSVWLRVISQAALEPIQGLWRNCALDVWTGGKAEPDVLPIVRSCHRAHRLMT